MSAREPRPDDLLPGRFTVVDAEPCDDRDDPARRGGFVWGVLVGVVIGAWAIAMIAVGHLVLR